jgi:hypothetical protein
VRPLSLIVAGLALVAIDYRFEALDIALDPVGWLLIVLGARQLARPVTVRVIGLAGVASCVEAVLPSHHARINTLTGEIIEGPVGSRLGTPQVLVFDRVSGLYLGLLALAVVLTGLASWMLLRDLSERAWMNGRRSTASQLGLLRGLVPGLWVLPSLIAMAVELIASGSYDPVWNDPLDYLTLVGLVPVVWLLVLLTLERDRAWAVPAASPVPPDWTDRPGRRRARGQLA